MDLFRAKYIILLMSSLLLLGAGIGFLFSRVFPEFYPQWYFLIPIYFFFIELVLIYIIDTGSKKLEAKKLVSLYMAVRVAKIILSLLFICIYALTVKIEIKSFALIFMLFYMFSIVFETIFFVNVEKRLKEKQ